jgi:hypothetical protein
MNGFFAEEFEADAPTDDTTTKANGPDTGNTAWPELGAAAYRGLAGEVVTTLLPQTEADPVALLLQHLTYFGNAVGRGPHYMVENDKHFANLFVLLAGNTAKARKGLSAGRIRHVFDTADPDWARECITGGMSSGEGVLHAIRDPVYTVKKGVSVMTDPGVADKRLLLDEREFYSALEVMKREGNILSRIVRDSWDCRPVLRTLTKNNQTRVTNGFISIVGHITIEELRQKLDHTSMANGYANRFLYGCVHRSKMLPFGGDELDTTDLGTRTRVAIETARNFDRVTMTAAAMELWVAVYPQLSCEVPGLLGSLTARAEGQTIRLALIYALLDGADEIDRVHLEAGLAVWAFCDASTRFIFGDVTGDTMADAILRALRSAGATGKTRTELHALFGNNRRGGEIGQALELLMQRGKARSVSTPPAGRRGRPIETWFAI